MSETKCYTRKGNSILLDKVNESLYKMHEDEFWAAMDSVVEVLQKMDYKLPKGYDDGFNYPIEILQCLDAKGLIDIGEDSIDHYMFDMYYI